MRRARLLPALLLLALTITQVAFAADAAPKTDVKPQPQAAPKEQPKPAPAAAAAADAVPAKASAQSVKPEQLSISISISSSKGLATFGAEAPLTVIIPTTGKPDAVSEVKPDSKSEVKPDVPKTAAQPNPTPILKETPQHTSGPTSNPSHISGIPRPTTSSSSSSGNAPVTSSNSATGGSSNGASSSNTKHAGGRVHVKPNIGSQDWQQLLEEIEHEVDKDMREQQRQQLYKYYRMKDNYGYDKYPEPHQPETYYPEPRYHFELHYKPDPYHPGLHYGDDSYGPEPYYPEAEPHYGVGPYYVKAQAADGADSSSSSSSSSSATKAVEKEFVYKKYAASAAPKDEADATELLIGKKQDDTVHWFFKQYAEEIPSLEKPTDKSIKHKVSAGIPGPEPHPEDIPRHYNHAGYDHEGYDKEGYRVDGYDENGFDREGYDRFGYNRLGYNRDGYQIEGYDKNGYDIYGYDRRGYDHKGYDVEGYDRYGYNDKGYNRRGMKRDYPPHGPYHAPHPGPYPGPHSGPHSGPYPGPHPGPYGHGYGPMDNPHPHDDHVHGHGGPHKGLDGLNRVAPGFMGARGFNAIEEDAHAQDMNMAMNKDSKDTPAPAADTQSARQAFESMLGDYQSNGVKTKDVKGAKPGAKGSQAQPKGAQGTKPSKGPSGFGWGTTPTKPSMSSWTG